MVFFLIAVSVSLTCLSFLIFIMIIYFSKQNMNNIDNKIYKRLLLWNCMCLISIVFGILADVYKMIDVCVFLQKIYMSTIINYLLYLVYYQIVILKSDDLKFKNFFKNDNKVFPFISILSILVIVFNFIAPLEYTLDKDGFITVTGGLSILLANIFTIFFLLFDITVVILYRKKADKKKIFPFKVLIFMIVGALIVASIYSNFGVTHCLITLISYLMYHTIENPDIKMVNELTLAKTQAEKSNKAKSEFLSSMSHELRTPLNAIVGLSQVVLQTTNEEETRTDVKEILNASNNLLELVDNILDVNMLDSNEIELKENEYNPRDLFDSLVKKASIRIGDKDIILKSDMSDEIPTCLYGNSNKIKTIIANLLSNAIKYTDSGSVKFSMDALNNKGICNLTITVSDTGKGIREDDIEKIFDQFYRSEDNKDSDIEGTGLGLSIVKSLVDLMNGKINVNSIPDSGTTFVVNLNQKIVEKEVNDLEVL